MPNLFNVRETKVLNEWLDVGMKEKGQENVELIVMNLCLRNF